MHLGLDLIWRWSENYPGSRPVTAFKRYINLVQFDTDYYYNVYPHATTNDVKAALRVQSAFDGLARKSESLTPEEFQKAWFAFQVHVSANLGARGIAPVGHNYGERQWQYVRSDDLVAGQRGRPAGYLPFYAASVTAVPFRITRL